LNVEGSGVQEFRSSGVSRREEEDLTPRAQRKSTEKGNPRIRRVIVRTHPCMQQKRKD
jgi:hypothetical protein